MILTYFVLPISRTSRHYLTVGLVVAVCLLQVSAHVPFVQDMVAYYLSWGLLFLSQQSRSNATMTSHQTTCTQT